MTTTATARSVARELDDLVGRLARLEVRVKESQLVGLALRDHIANELDTVTAAIIVQARRLERSTG